MQMNKYYGICELNLREKHKPQIHNNNHDFYKVSQKRDRLVHWLIENIDQMNVSLKTIELSVLYLEIVLNNITISESYFQLLAISCFNLAAKFYQKGFTNQTQLTNSNGQKLYTDQEYQDMEILILQTLDYQLNYVTSSDYAVILGLNVKDSSIKAYFMFILIDYNIYKYNHLELALAILLLSKPGQYKFQPSIFQISSVIQNAISDQEKLLDSPEMDKNSQKQIKRARRMKKIRKYLKKL